MSRHWEVTLTVSSEDYSKFLKHNSPLKPPVGLPYNTGVLVQNQNGGKLLEGVYDPTVDGIRPLKDTSGPNRDIRLYKDAVQSGHITFLAVDGLMGTGKTSTSIEYAVSKLPNTTYLRMTDTNDHRVLIAKPYVNSGGEEYGFLPGDIDDKFDPTLVNYIQYFDRMHSAGYDKLRDSGLVQVMPLGFIRGLDGENMTIIVDECQNTKELISMATRKAKDTRIFFLGDTSPFQIDLPGNTPKKNGLHDLIDLLAGAPYFQYIEMKSVAHILRSDEVRDIVRRLLRKYGQDPKEWAL